MIEQIPAPMRDEIERRLARIEADEGVRYLFAVESGSRAWGFPSPDSDYDVRFVYVRPRDWYLQLEPGRDVIERPIVDEIDLNGWDLGKFLKLLLRSNAVTGEWMSSPIRYRQDDPVVSKMADLAQSIFNPRRVAHHYANLGRTAAERWLEGDDPAPVKRYFYALRPALAIRSLRCDPSCPPPMNLQELVAASDLPDLLVRIIEELVEAKRRTRERGNAKRYPELDALIADELARPDELPVRPADAGATDAANALFLDLLNT